jgi:hypothetical protein
MGSESKHQANATSIAFRFARQPGVAGVEPENRKQGTIKMGETTMCGACSHIEIGRRDAAAHPRLVKDGPAIAHGAVVYQRYVCETCGTRWLHMNDPNDADFGWEVAE